MLRACLLGGLQGCLAFACKGAWRLLARVLGVCLQGCLLAGLHRLALAPSAGVAVALARAAALRGYLLPPRAGGPWLAREGGTASGAGADRRRDLRGAAPPPPPNTTFIQIPQNAAPYTELLEKRFLFHAHSATGPTFRTLHPFYFFAQRLTCCPVDGDTGR